MSTANIISLIVNLLFGGGALAVWLKYRVQSRGEDRADFSTIAEELARQRDAAIEDKTELGLRITNLEAEIQGLRIARDLDPFPNWIADLQGHYLFVNREFERHFLEPKGQNYRDAIGKTNAEIWPAAFSKNLSSLSAAARERQEGTARAITALDVPSLGACEVTVHQFPVRIRGIVTAMAGYITVMEPERRKIG